MINVVIVCSSLTVGLNSF